MGTGELTGLLLILGGIVLVAIIIGTYLGRVSGSGLTELFMSTQARFRKPQPVYSTPRALVKQRQYKEAVEAYQEILKEHKEDPTALFELALLYDEKLRDYDNALDCYSRAEQTAPDKDTLVGSLNRKADIYVRLHHYDYAIFELKKVIRKYPDSKAARWTQEKIDLCIRQGGRDA